jgi:hypothetical protein
MMIRDEKTCLTIRMLQPSPLKKSHLEI